MKETTNFRDLLREHLKDPEQRLGFEIERMKLLPARIALDLAQARKAKGITQQQLAEMIGTKQAYITRFERGRQTAVTLKTLIRIAEALGVTLDFFIKPAAETSGKNGRPKKYKVGEQVPTGEAGVFLPGSVKVRTGGVEIIPTVKTRLRKAA